MAHHFPPEHHCSQCDKSYHTAHRLKRHMATHSGNPYKCHFCEFTTVWRKSMKNHYFWHWKKSAMASKPDSEPNITLIEAFRSSIDRNRVDLSGHLTASNRTKWATKVKVKTLPPPYTGPRQPGDGYHCYYCPKAFSRKYHLKNHMCTHLPPQYFCKLCGFGFSNFRYYCRHKNIAHSSAKTFKCHWCDYTAKWDSTLLHHVRKVHHNNTETTSDAQSLVACYHCGWTTDYKFKLVRHMKRHLRRGALSETIKMESGDRLSPLKRALPVVCSLCDYKGTSRPALRKHIQREHSGKILKCEMCDFQTKHPRSIKIHKMGHKNERPYACPYCNYRAIEKSKLTMHVEQHAGKELHECPVCGFRCLSAVTLKKHLVCHSGAPNLMCSMCQFSTFHLHSFVQHLKKHVAAPADGKTHPCQLCDHVAETIKHLYEHIRSHHRVRNFKCPHCPYATFTQATLNEHVNALHTKELLYSCQFCDFKTAYRHSLKGHTNSVHTRSNWFNCQYCDFRALLKRTVAFHERRHMGDRRYECELCGVKTFTLTSLKSHRQIHTGDRPFACDKCDFRGYTKYAVQRHKQGLHNAERPFKCSFCSECFKTKQTAHYHELCHTGKKLYECTKCTYASVVHRHLRSHMSEMHPTNSKQKKLPETYPSGRKKRWYRCDKCAFAVLCKPSLARHIKLRHPINNKS